MLLNSFEEFIKRISLVKSESISDDGRSITWVAQSKNIHIDNKVRSCWQGKTKCEESIIRLNFEPAFPTFYI